jgi:DNA repair protein RadD
MISDFLNRIDESDLINLLGSEKIRSIKDLLCIEESELTKSVIVDFIIALYGYDILADKRIRHLIFLTLNDDVLVHLCFKYCTKSYSKSYDNSLHLSLLPWRYGSEFVVEVTDLLNIPSLYLPIDNEHVSDSFIVSPKRELTPLHDYQEEIKLKIISELSGLNNRFLVQMPTGSGKTRTLLQSIIEFSFMKRYFECGRHVLWLAHTEELCEQAIATFSYLWCNLSDYSISVVRCFGNHSLSVTDLKGSFIVGTLQKFASLHASNSYLLTSLKYKLEIIIVDEAHKSVALTYSSMLNFLTNNSEVKLIGTTATPGRSFDNDSSNYGLSSFYNFRLLTPTFRINPILELRNKGILTYLDHRVINSEFSLSFSDNELRSINTTGDFSMATLKRLEENVERNKLILRVIENEVNSNNPCLIFTCSVKHAQILNAALTYKNYRSFALDYSVSKNRRYKIIEDFKNGNCMVLFNFGLLSTGFDAPNVRSIIITRPTSSVVLYSQMIGRGLRGPRMGGGTNCSLIDIKDNFVNYGGVESVYDYFKDYWL